MCNARVPGFSGLFVPASSALRWMYVLLATWLCCADFYKGTGGHKWGSHTSKGEATWRKQVKARISIVVCAGNLVSTSLTAAILP